MKKPPPSDFRSHNQDAGRIFVPLVVLFAAFMAFLPALRGGFVWDDSVIVRSTGWRGFGWDNLKWMFGPPPFDKYQPLVWLSYAVDRCFWGMDPYGWHLSNLVLHALAALAFYFVCMRLLVRAPRAPADTDLFELRLAAGFAALVFAVHPLRVESVAWITERSDILSGLFSLLAVWAYLRIHDTPAGADSRSCWLALSLVFFASALLSKTITIGLPLVLIALDIYLLDRLPRESNRWFSATAKSVWKEKIAYILPAAAAGLVGYLGQARSGSIRSMENFGFGARAAQSFYGLVFYLRKTLLPIRLSPMYELPDPFNPLAPKFILSGIAAAALGVWLFARRRSRPAAFAAGLCYLAIVAPVLGIVPIGHQLAADRYSYLSCMAWAILAGGIFLRAHRRWPAEARVLALGAVSTLIFLTGRQTRIWHDEASLWTGALAAYPQSRIAENNLGFELMRHGQYDEAERHFRRALEISPAYAEAVTNLGNIDYLRGLGDEALREYGRALILNPRLYNVHVNIGIILMKRGEFARALDEYGQAAAIKPDYLDAINGMGMAYLYLGNFAEARKLLLEAQKIDPDSSEVRENIVLLGQMENRRSGGHG